MKNSTWNQRRERKVCLRCCAPIAQHGAERKKIAYAFSSRLRVSQSEQLHIDYEMHTLISTRIFFAFLVTIALFS